MTRASVQQFSSDPTQNTDIAGINIAVGWPPTNIGSALRELMALLADCLNPTSIALTGTTVTLTPVQASALAKTFTGTLSADCLVVMPNAPFLGFFGNATVGGKKVTISTGVGTSVTLPNDSSLSFLLIDSQGNVITTPLNVGSFEASGLARFFGNLQVGLSAPAPGAIIYPNGVFQIGTVAAPNGWAYEAFYNNGVVAGSINFNGTGVNYNQTSDERLKVDHGTIGPGEAMSLVRRIKAKWFRWRSCPDDDVTAGFFAQQLARVFPQAVFRGKGRPGSKGFQPWQVDSSKLIPVLVAALQDADTRLKALERAI